MRYFATSLLILAAFGLALYQREAQDPAVPKAEPVTVLERTPEIATAEVAGGTHLVVRYRFAGSCSRAKVVYREQGEERVLAVTTDCRRSLNESGQLSGDGYVSEVELRGTLPHGASDVRLVLESETGTSVARIEL